MNQMRRNDDGFSMVEMLVAIAVFSLVAFAFLAVMRTTARSTDQTRADVEISEEARLGLNRMVRDTREAGWITLSSSSPGAVHNSYTVHIDYNGDGSFSNPLPPNAPPEGNFEIVTYAYDAAGERLTISATGFGAETIVEGVKAIPGKDVFTFTSRLEYDWNGNGVATLQEIDAAPCPGNNVTTLDTGCSNGTLVNAELGAISSVNMAFEVEVGDKGSDYYAEAQLRNRR